MPHYRLTAQGSLPAGDIWETTISVLPTAGQDAGAMLVLWNTAWTLAWNGTGASDDIKSLVKTTVTTDTLIATQIGDDGKNMTQAISSVTLAGTATDDCMPQETCPVISLRTANASKAGRGRMYWPPLTEASNAGNGEIQTASQSQLADAAQNMLQSINGASASAVVHHRALNTNDAIIGCDVANLFRVQRRRQKSVTVVRARRSV